MPLSLDFTVAQEHIYSHTDEPLVANDAAWKTIPQPSKENTISNIQPWFHTTYIVTVGGLNEDWKMTKKLGDLGLLPIELRKTIQEPTNNTETTNQIMAQI